MRHLALALLLTTGCADVCSRGATLNKTFPARHAACFARDTLPSPPFNVKQCDASMKACTPEDDTALHAYFDCLEKLPVCTEATRAAFNEKVLTCAAGMGQLTDGLTDGCFRP